MRWSLGFFSTGLLISLLVVPCHAGDVADYLGEDGKLKKSVTIRTGGVAFLAPPGEVWTIEPTGDWVWKYTDSKGKLSSKQMAALVHHLAAQDFNSLPKTQGYNPKAGSGYHRVVIAFGKKEAAFVTKNGQSRADYLPKSGDPNATAWSRFRAVEWALADILKMSKVRAEYAAASSGDNGSVKQLVGDDGK
jgi:hypothetical protein